MQSREKIYDLADTFLALRDRKEDLKAQLTTVGAELDIAEQKLFDEIDKRQADHLNYKGKNLIQTNKRKYNLIPEMKAELYALIRAKETVGELEDMFSVNAQKLSSWVRDTTEVHKETLPPAAQINVKIAPELEQYFNVFSETGITVRAASKKQ